MGLGQWSCYLKIPLQTFDTETAATLTPSCLCIVLVMASDLLGGGAGRGVLRGWRQGLYFQTQEGQNEAFKVILPHRELREPAAF